MTKMTAQDGILKFRRHIDSELSPKHHYWSDQRGDLALIPDDVHPVDMASEVLEGLRHPKKSIAPKYFYDDRGSVLFQSICETPEYYLTDVERSILRQNASTIVNLMAPSHTLLELGSGDSQKTCLLFTDWFSKKKKHHYIPVDISASALKSSIPYLLDQFPELWVTGLNTTYHVTFNTLQSHQSDYPLSILFLGSNIGNFNPAERGQFFSRISRVMSGEDTFLFGADLQKDKSTLEAAYNDERGLTREFNLNILRRLNRELSSDFNLEQFIHRAFYNEKEGRIEMHLESHCDQEVNLKGENIKFKKYERIHTENSYKFSQGSLTDELSQAGLRAIRVMKDHQDYFSVWIVKKD